MRTLNATTALVLLIGLSGCPEPSTAVPTAAAAPVLAATPRPAPERELAQASSATSSPRTSLPVAPPVPIGANGLPLKVGRIPNLQPADAPPGFPELDEFRDSTEACNALVPRLVAREDLREPVLAWCLSRVFHSSRNGKVRSRLDGSQIHDRDRGAARSFYKRGLEAGFLDPKVCPHHVVDDKARQPSSAREFVDRWPYGTHCDYTQGSCTPSKPGHMLASKAEEWLKHSPDYEAFGTRGPVDHNYWGVVRYLGGCFPPSALDRHDVSAATTILRSVALCERLEHKIDTRPERRAMRGSGYPIKCRTRHDIRDLWHPRFWYEELPRVLTGPKPSP